MDVPFAEQERRRADVRIAVKAMSHPVGLGFLTDPEDHYLLSDAVRCYVNAADAGAIFCVHASCERDLAAMVQASGSAPTGSERWALGALVTYCASHGLLPSAVLDNLRLLNDHRKTLYHYGHSESQTALRQRTYELIAEIGSSKLHEDFMDMRGHEGASKELYAFAMDRVMQQSALSALTTGFILRSWLAHPL